MAWTTRAKASDGESLLLCYDGDRDPRDSTAMKFVNPRTLRIEALRQDPAYPFTWTITTEDECPDDATHVALRW
jgi:hypothetical protein